MASDLRAPNRLTDRSSHGIRALFSIWPIACFLVAWEIAARLGALNAAFLPAPSNILNALITMVSDGTLTSAILQSLGRVVAGFSIASITGVSAAIASTINRSVRHNIYPLVEFLRPISPIAWIPLAILWFPQPGIFIVFIASVFPIYLYAVSGISNIPESAVVAARALRATKRQLLEHVIVPAALPTFLEGMRLGLGLAWMSVIAAELFAVQNGLGYLIQISRLSARPDVTIACMITIGLIGLLMSGAISLIRSLAAPWSKVRRVEVDS